MTQRFADDPHGIPGTRIIAKAILRSYDDTAHEAAVQLVGSHPTLLAALRVATSIPPADVVAGRQCTVLFLDPANQDDAVILAIQGALPSVGAILSAAASGNLTLTGSFQDVAGATVTLPTPGDWLITAAVHFIHSGAGDAGVVGRCQLLVDGVAQTPQAVAKLTTDLSETIVQTWKVTTTQTDRIAKLQGKKDSGTGASVIGATHTTITAAGVQRSTGGGGVTDHGALTGLADDDHTQYGALAQAETVAALWTFSAGLKLAAGQAIKDSGGTDRITPKTTGPNVLLTGDVRVEDGDLHLNDAGFGGGHLGVNVAPATAKQLYVVATGTHSGAHVLVEATVSGYNFSGNNCGLRGVKGDPQANVPSASTGHTLRGLEYQAIVAGGGGGATVSDMAGIYVTLGAISFSGTIALMRGIAIQTPLVLFGSPSITLSKGIEIGNVGKTAGVDAVALEIANVTTNSGYKRLIEALGLTGPNLRLEAGDPTSPGASKGRSQLLLDLNENGTINLRRVEWIDSGAAGGAGIPANTKLLVAV